MGCKCTFPTYNKMQHTLASLNFLLLCILDLLNEVDQIVLVEQN